MTIRFSRESRGRYAVNVDGEPVGAVEQTFQPSHIRRGRMRVDPDWQAFDLAGRPVGLPYSMRRTAAAALAAKATA